MSKRGQEEHAARQWGHSAPAAGRLPQAHPPAKRCASARPGPAPAGWLLWAALAVLVLLLGLAGSMDAEDAVLAAELYCDHVHAGLWPDYLGSYAQQCTPDGELR